MNIYLIERGEHDDTDLDTNLAHVIVAKMKRMSKNSQRKTLVMRGVTYG